MVNLGRMVFVSELRLIILPFEIPSADEFEDGGSDPDEIAVLQRGADDFDIVDVNSVLAVEILDHRLIILPIKLGVISRDGLLIDRDLDLIPGRPGSVSGLAYISSQVFYPK